MFQECPSIPHVPLHREDYTMIYQSNIYIYIYIGLACLRSKDEPRLLPVQCTVLGLSAATCRDQLALGKKSAALPGDPWRHHHGLGNIGIFGPSAGVGVTVP